jgi:hypothetical protein
MKIALNALRVAALALAFTKATYAGPVTTDANMHLILADRNGYKTNVKYSYEFHDDNDSTTIHGYIGAVKKENGLITGFTINATVKNNGYAILKNAVICAEFARGERFYKFFKERGFVSYPFTAAHGSFRYVATDNQTYIYRNNPSPVPSAYIVPTWMLGDIAPNGIKRITMNFRIIGGFSPTSVPGKNITGLQTYKTDIFGNNSSTAKRIPVYPLPGITTQPNTVSVFSI